MRWQKKNKALTLIEIVVASIIMITALAGLLAAFTASRKYTSRATTRNTITNVGRGILEELHTNVRADTWDNATNTLYNGTYAFSRQVGARTYNGNYSVENTSRQYRQVTVNVTF